MMNETRETNRKGFTRRNLLEGSVSLASATLVLKAFPTQASTTINPFAAATLTGPSSVVVPGIGTTASAPATPYLLPTAPGWSSVSLMTVGNEAGGYRMAGIPDGLGAFANGDRTITLLMNHEIRAGLGKVRGHGGTGAFVSRWVIDKDTLAVVSGSDFVRTPENFHVQGSSRDLTRLCSADLAPKSAFFNAVTGKGYDGLMLLNGEEEGGNMNRAFAWVVADGSAYQLAPFGFGSGANATDAPPSWENLLANPGTGDTTVVMGASDGGTRQVYVYIGSKQTEGSPVEKAGLINGKLFALQISGVTEESRDTNIGIAKSIAVKGEGKRVNLAAPNKGTSFLRPEDGAWDPRNPNIFYFVTTDRNDFASDASVRYDQIRTQVARSRLWAVTFDDVTKIATDGTPTAKIEMLLDGTEGIYMLDNIAVDKQGIITMCEDPGLSRHESKVWTYDTTSSQLTAIMQMDRALTGSVNGEGGYTAPTKPFKDDNESSGVIDVTDLLADAAWFRPGSKALLIVVQAHFSYDTTDPIGAELVEGGQLLVLVKAA
jgi:secreted PhoX family phosphatase